MPVEGPMSAKQVRKIADDFDNGKGYNIYEEDGDGGVSLCAVKTIDCQNALRQGADAIERLEAVVKLLTEHEKFTSCKKCGLHREFGCADPHDCSTQEWNVKFQEMLRIAKGEKK